MTRKILRATATGLLLAAGMGAAAWADEDKSRLDRAADNCKEQLRTTFSLDEDQELSVARTTKRKLDRVFIHVTVDVPGVGPRKIRCQVNEHNDGIRRLRVFDENKEDNNGWGDVTALAETAAAAAEEMAAEKEAAAAAAAADADGDESASEGDGATAEGDDATAEGDDATAEGEAGTGTPEEGDAESADGADAADGDDEASEEETAEAEEEKVPSGPVFKRVK